MEVTDELISDMVRVKVGSWTKDDVGVWRFSPADGQVGKNIRFREGDGVEAAKTKVVAEFNIDREREKVELTYEMPEWMDVDGGVKPVPIHIVSDDDMDMFLAMRVDIHEMKLYVVPMPMNMMLEIDGFKMVPLIDEFAFGEVMSKEEFAKENRRRLDKEAGDNIICSQVPREHVGDSGDGPLGWIGGSYAASGFPTLSAAWRHYKTAAEAVQNHGSPASVLEPQGSSSSDDNRVTKLTRDLFSDFERAATSSGDVRSPSETQAAGVGQGDGAELNNGNEVIPNTNTEQRNEPPETGMLRLLSLPVHTFARDAAPVLDDNDPDGSERTRLVVLDVDYEGDELFVGRVFKNRDDCRVKLAVHAINRKFSYRNDRTTNDVVIVRCLSDACPWRVYCVRLEDTDYFEVRTATLEHTCPIEVRSQYPRQATTSVISQIMKSKYTGAGTGPTPIAIRQALMDEYSVNVSYWKAWLSRELAMDMAKGSPMGSYGILPTYLHMLTRANTGTVTDLQTEEDGNGDSRFKYCFVALGASVRGWSFMRDVVIIDGAHLRGKYAGCLLTASAQDGNFQIFPIAFGIVDGENDKAWEWFFTCLKQIVPDGENLTFVSDRHSSIYTGLGKVYPRASHGACIVHLQRNVAAKYKKRILATLISKAARAFRKSTFNEYFEEIERVSPGCAEYLMSIGLEHWTRSHCYGDRYNIMTSNVAESLNAVLKEARELPIVSTLEYIRGTLMTWFEKRRGKAAQHKMDLTPKVEEIVQRNYERSTCYEVIKINNEKYEIKTTTGLSYVVDIQNKTCTCAEFNLLRIPCSHAIAAAVRCDLKVPLLAAPHYGTFFWSLAYNGNINPVPDLSTLREVPDGIATRTVLPPITRRPPGRPKRTRYLSTGEFKTQKKKAKRSCTRCRGTGHNRASCKMPI
ncbi:MULE transposase domain [Arabidopsis thaliana x Arabidopsis arenosa]|uniref:MULE transposase domain n=1 Tax=Arabidopsis thaliana x Arabidopsis arenosa TaxID=1240361 RepID=A0A8T1ZJB7_9BRAS|nr:MULE transposase domain [Arabidopsis thaliana x Arabidopsis arenosa]